MKKVFSLILVLGLMAGCSSEEKEVSTKKETKEETKEVKKDESYLSKVEEVMTVEISTDSSGSDLVIATIGDDVSRFMYYASISDDSKSLADAMGIKVGSIVYENYTYNYAIDSKTQIYAHEEITNEEIQKEIDEVLNGYGLTVDNLRSALKEKYEAK